jgi:hypothetical protein
LTSLSTEAALGGCGPRPFLLDVGESLTTIVVSKIRVPDCARWAAQFEAGADSRRSFGVKALAFGQDRAAKGTVYIILKVRSEEHARKLQEHPTFRNNVEEQDVVQLELVVLDS